MNTDPIADMLTRIRNANIAKHSSLELPHSKVKEKLAELLKSEGYISEFAVSQNGQFKKLSINLKYTSKDKPVISNLKRISRPGLRRYSKAKSVPRVFGGLGIAIISTSQGLTTDRKARAQNIGGEVLCYVW
jgi:small subunit ribosomal protein S8